jgi:hypothetical protein
VRANYSKDWPSLEVEMKAINYRADFFLKAIKHFCDKRPIIERYFRGQLSCHHHGTDHAYCAVTTVMHRRLNQSEMPVFVGVGEITERFGPFTAVTRLQSLERCLVSGSQPVKPHLAALFRGRLGRGDMAVPFIYRRFDEKLSATMSLTRVQTEKLIDEIIEAPPEIVDRLPDENGEDWGCSDILRTATDEGWTHHCGRDRTVRRKDAVISRSRLAMCSFALFTRARASSRDGLRRLVLGMTDKTLDDTKRLMGALLRMPPKPHSEMKIGKPKAKRHKSPKRKRATNALSASAKSA